MSVAMFLVQKRTFLDNNTTVMGQNSSVYKKVKLSLCLIN
jgi:hypothetical protein